MAENRKLEIRVLRNSDIFEIAKNVREYIKGKKNPEILSSSTSCMLWPTPVYVHIVYIEYDEGEKEEIPK